MSDMNKKPTIFTASGFFLLAAVGLLAVSFCTSLLITGGGAEGISNETLNMLYGLSYYLPFLLLPALLWASRRGAGALRLNPVSFATTVRIVIIALMSVSVVSNFDVFWHALWQRLGMNVFITSYVRPASTSELTLSILNVCLLVPVCEELLFRGVILSAWEDRGRRSAVLASAVLFSMLHGSLLGLPGQLYGGIVMALLVIWTDSIYAGIIYHGVFNGFATILNYITSAGPSDPVEDSLLRNDIVAAMGGPGTLLVLLFDIALMLMMIRFLMRGLRMFDALRRAGAEVSPSGRLMMTERIHAHMRDCAMQQQEDRRAGRKPRPFMPPEPPVSTGRLPIRELLMLGAGMAVTLVLYILDISMMLGG